MTTSDVSNWSCCIRYYEYNVSSFFCFAPAFSECIDAFVIQYYTYSAITHKPNGLHVVCRRTQIDVDDDSQQ